MIYRDKNGIQMYPGDLIRTLHFIGARRKRNYIYHVVVKEGDELFMVPTSHLEPTKVKGGGKANLRHIHGREEMEIISGYGPGDILSFEDRPKMKGVPA